MSNTPFKAITPFKTLTPALGDLSNRKVFGGAWKTPGLEAASPEKVHGHVDVKRDYCQDLLETVKNAQYWSSSDSEEPQEVRVAMDSEEFQYSQGEVLDFEITGFLASDTVSYIPEE